ncbi:DUF397 domain-containing protein [Nocardia cyriacigeorgica]|uniref:DUF397 domain-containing protein n=1 Tax=Nocardia cyriacigeorgica (strain GUH-2) TaxID=1127134 RepID=H6R4B9_NOCCG|nr:DUF397 domain-containing protein [Nocardia cyriacigeorgica]MBF6289782.1 DUF397 domain-containing protein [Nocardia cyriacigeorgica]CCF61988.1 conserved protein of unknown function [Nocardia cyriacigeorgica GUH-2]
MGSGVDGARWFKSSRSVGGNDCVEVAHLGQGCIGVRDSKNPTGPALVFTPAEWASFLTHTRAGHFDHH